MLTISKGNQINEEIRDKELRVIDEDGEMLGVMSRDEALSLAAQKNLDLLSISPNAKPPVCKILDYGKYRYELQKKKPRRSRATRRLRKLDSVHLSRIMTFK